MTQPYPFTHTADTWHASVRRASGFVQTGFWDAKLISSDGRQLGKWELGVQLTLNPPLRALTSAFRANPYESGHLG
jgi:hypothetical protein